MGDDYRRRRLDYFFRAQSRARHIERELHQESETFEESAEWWGFHPVEEYEGEMKAK